MRNPLLSVCSVLILGAPVAAAAQNKDTIPNAGPRHVLIGAAVVGATLLLDKPIAHAFESPYTAGTAQTAKDFNKFGEPLGVGVALGGLAVASLITRDHRVVQALFGTAGSAFGAFVATQVIKYSVGRERPYADVDHDGLDFHPFSGTPVGSPSFISGHTALAFALATSLGDAAGTNWVRIPLWTLAAGTGWARLQLDQHWVSDVVVGAFVGIVSAKFANGKLKILGVTAPHFMVAKGSAGFAWTMPMPVIR